MGEYAKVYGTKVKIGTCSNMYYLRYEDRNNVLPLPGNIDARIAKNLYWRLPFPDEDHIRIGSYGNAFRYQELYKEVYDRRLGKRIEYFNDPTTAEFPGTIQLRHPCGILANVSCYHGVKLPDNTPSASFFWNGKNLNAFGLCSIKNEEMEIKLVFKCLHCNELFSCVGEEAFELLEYVPDLELRNRLTKIIKEYE